MNLSKTPKTEPNFSTKNSFESLETTEHPNYSIRKMLERIFQDKNLEGQCKKDLVKVYTQVSELDKKITINPEEIANIYLEIMKQGIHQNISTQKIEQNINDAFEKNGVNRLLFLSTEDRRDTILGTKQKGPWLASYIQSGMNIIDYGIGSGQLAQKIQETYPETKVIGTDVVKYYFNEHCTVPYEPIIEGTAKNVIGNSADLVTVYNVIHHEAENQCILDDIDRITKPGGRISIIETVPDYTRISVDKRILLEGYNRNTGRLFLPKAENTYANSLIERFIHGSESTSLFNFVDGLSVTESQEILERAQDRNHFNDHEWNRTVTPPSNQVHVPGTYECVLGWLIRCANMGWKLVDNSLELYGYDMLGIEDYHVGFEFEKTADKE